MKKPMFPLQLKEACMAFELKDGQMLLIHEEDVKTICDRIMFNVLADLKNPNILVRNPIDINLDRVKKIQEILIQKDIDADVRQAYYKQILVLLSEKGEIESVDKPFYDKEL